MAEGADDNVKKHELYGRKLIFRAAECNDVSLLKQLLSERPEDVDLKDEYKSTPLLVAALFNDGVSHFEFMKVLLEHGANVNAHNGEDGLSWS